MTFLRTLLACFATCILGTAAADCRLPFGAEAGLGYDFFRSIPDGSWEGNTGAFASVNLWKKLPAKYCGLGMQLGASYGVYDWNGRLSSPSGEDGSSQQQAFATVGIFRETPCESGFNAGLVYDWMWTKNFGAFALDPKIDQLRFQGGYLLCCRNEFGIWGTLDLHWSRNSSFEIPVTYRALSQVNAFWRHIFSNCAETMLWAGVPYKRSLLFSSGLAGKFIIGGSFRAPLTSRLEIEGHGSYMHPRSRSGSPKPLNYAANICIELKWSFGDRACGAQSYMPLGNNSNFLVDSNLNY